MAATEEVAHGHAARAAACKALQMATDQAEAAAAGLQRLRHAHVRAVQAERATAASLRRNVESTGLVDAKAAARSLLCTEVTLCAERAAEHARG
eukprot:6562844-Pyramimonas_sp.AAC.1